MQVMKYTKFLLIFFSSNITYELTASKFFIICLLFIIFLMIYFKLYIIHQVKLKFYNFFNRLRILKIHLFDDSYTFLQNVI